MVTGPDGSLFGMLSAGDISRYLSLEETDNLGDVIISDVCNQTPTTAHTSDSIDTINKIFENPRIKSIPILDSRRLVVKVATAQAPFLYFGTVRVSESDKPFLLAEIGVNHNGSIKEALFLIHQAFESGCDGVKFQHRSLDLYNRDDLNKYDLGTQYIMSEIERTKLSIDDLCQCCEYARSLGLEVVITPFDEAAYDEICINVDYFSAIKIASCDLTNKFLIDYIAKSINGKPIVLSTGMSYEREIMNASAQLLNLKLDHAFLHCNSTYPSPASDINLSYIKRLKEITGTVVGYSSHDGDGCIPISSLCYGASIVEFHITRNKEASGTDHRASILTSQLSQFVNDCKKIYLSIGTNSPRMPSQGELANLQSLGKSLASKNFLEVGHILKKDDFVLISPGSGFPVSMVDTLVGKKIVKPIKPRCIFASSDIKEFAISEYEKLDQSLIALEDRGYIPGIPVRFHDSDEMSTIFKTKMVEFHMSDRDLSLDPNKFLHHDYSRKFLIVHAVEQFEDGFIFDLASHSSSSIERSFNEIERIVKVIDKLRVKFMPVETIPIVLNPGGFTNDGFLEDTESEKRLLLIIKNLNRLADAYPRYEFLPQTMPPFPWHQGGQSYHNVLTSASKIQSFLLNCRFNICLDLSHTAMSCSFFSESIYEHISLMNARISHIHLSDARGSNAEGLEIGSGSLDFRKIHTALDLRNKKFMIPEIWQGHVNTGEKFAISLIRFASLIA